MRRVLPLVLMLAIVPALAQESMPSNADGLKLEAEYKVDAGDFLIVEPSTKGKRVVWFPIDEVAGRLSIMDPAKSKNANTLTLVGKMPGRYRWIAVTALGDDPIVAQTLIVVVGPPAPPGPTPPPPRPDTLKPLLQKAYDLDPSPAVARRAFVVALSGFYEAAADYAQAANLQTTQALLEKLRAERPKFVPDERLVEVRKVIQAEQLATFGHAPDALLDDGTRAKAKELFSRVATALMEVK